MQYSRGLTSGVPLPDDNIRTKLGLRTIPGRITTVVTAVRYITVFGTTKW